MNAPVLVDVVVVDGPADVVDGRRRVAVVVDLARQRQRHADLRVVLEVVRIDVLRRLASHAHLQCSEQK